MFNVNLAQARAKRSKLRRNWSESLANYRSGLRVGLWLFVVFGGLAGVSVVLWGLLGALGDLSGALVARVLLFVWLGALFVDLMAMVALLALVQLERFEREHDSRDQFKNSSGKS